MRIIIFFLNALAWLPFPLLYVKSWFLRFLLEKVFTYRKAVITENLKNSFPNKSDAERASVLHDFYGYLADMVVETAKLNRMSKKHVLERVTFSNLELLKPYESNGRNVIIMMGHSGNWEWANAATELSFNFKILPVYRRLSSPAFEHFYYSLRSKFGSLPVMDRNAFVEIQKAPKPHAVAMLTDQTPSKMKGWWATFLNQPTAFFRGSEILAKRLKYDVLFAQVRRTEQQGYYSIYFERPELNWQEKEHGLTLAFASFLEKEIKLDPANWLWSHRRWKHEPDEEVLWIG
jgi:Kdo2-lipid IVA lauroyltransferase/acyltransferase